MTTPRPRRPKIQEQTVGEGAAPAPTLTPQGATDDFVSADAAGADDAEAAKKKPGRPKKADAPELPARIRLRVAHGFVEEVHNRGIYQWKAGEVIDNPATIALLIERGAAYDVI